MTWELLVSIAAGIVSIVGAIKGIEWIIDLIGKQKRKKIIETSVEVVKDETTSIEEYMKKFDKKLDKINDEIDKINEHANKRDIENCRVHINSFLNRVESNPNAIDQVEYQLYHEIYDRYTNELHQNSYIHDKWNRIMNNK